GKVCHRLKLSFTSRPKAMHVTNKARAASQASSKNLVDEMLQRFEQFAGLRLQQLCIVALDVQNFARDALLHADAQLQTSLLKDVLEKLRCLLRHLCHLT